MKLYFYEIIHKEEIHIFDLSIEVISDMRYNLHLSDNAYL